MLTSNYVSWSHTIIPLIKTNCANLSSIKYNVVVHTYQMLSILGNPWNYQENSMTSENFVVQIVALFPSIHNPAVVSCSQLKSAVVSCSTTVESVMESPNCSVLFEYERQLLSSVTFLGLNFSLFYNCSGLRWWTDVSVLCNYFSVSS